MIHALPMFANHDSYHKIGPFSNNEFRQSKGID